MKTVWRVFAYLQAVSWMAAGTLSCAILTTLMVIVFSERHQMDHQTSGARAEPDKLLPLIFAAAVAFLASARFNHCGSS